MRETHGDFKEKRERGHSLLEGDLEKTIGRYMLYFLILEINILDIYSTEIKKLLTLFSSCCICINRVVIVCE